MLFLAEHTVRLSLQGTFSVYQLPQLYQHDNLCVLNSFFLIMKLGLVRVYMVRYELILNLDGALGLMIISKPFT